MKRAKDKNRYMINRTMYKDIKKYDHQQMESFLGDIYKSGYQDGQDEITIVSLQDVKDALHGTKGIGPKTWPLIEERLNALFEDKEAKKDEQ